MDAHGTESSPKYIYGNSKPEKALSQKKVKENPEWCLQEMSRFVEKVTELSHFSGHNRVGCSAKGGEFRIIVGLGCSHSWTGRSSRMPCACRISQAQLPLHCPGARAGQSKRAAASKRFLDGQELQIPHY